MFGRTSPRRSTTTVGAALGLAAACLFVAASGCTERYAQSLPKIDPTGQRLFTNDSPYRQVPGPIGVGDTTSVVVTPAKIIAPVGSEVVVQAAVCGQDRTLMAGEKVEWSIAGGSVGYFVQAGEEGPLEWFRHVGYRTRKVDNTFAVSATSPKFIMLNRGTPTPSDDVPILRGQAWATLSSPLEGTSYVTAVAPTVHGWQAHKQTAVVYWVDAQWTFPPPAINPAGSRHAFTTTLVRHTNHCPLAGWRVRYELAGGGPSSGFAPDGVRSIEVPTNALGQATVEIFQPQPSAGTNTVNVTVIRPADWPGGDGTPLAVGGGGTQMTWTVPGGGGSGTTAGGLSIDKSGPTEASVGSTLTYRIVVRNPSDLTIRGLTVTDAVPTGLAFLGSTPQATVVGTNLSWQLGDLAAGQSRQIELTFQAQQPAAVNNCATVRSADGASAQDCAATTVTASTVELTMVGPAQAGVGDELTFIATATNRGSAPATNLVLLDRFDDGLKHEFSSSPIENRELGNLPAGASKSINVRLRAVQPGRWCNRMELSGDNGVRGSAQACVTVVQASGTTVPPVVTPPPNAGGAPVLSVRKSGPPRAAVGETVTFSIVVENRGSAAATNLRLVDNYDLALKPARASDGWQLSGNDLYWTLAALQPGQSYERKIECICQSPAAGACNRAIVTCQEGVRQDAQACLEIVGRQSAPLTVSIVEQKDPLPVGEEAVYTVRVTNPGPTAEREVAVAVVLPGEMAPAGGTSGPTQFALSGNTLRFAPVAELRSGETLTYQIRASARRAGKTTLRVDVTGGSSPTAVTAAEATTIF